MLNFLRNALFRAPRIKVPEDGMRAAWEGFKLADNPHRQHTPAHSIWRDDWLDSHGRRQ